MRKAIVRMVLAALTAAVLVTLYACDGNGTDPGPGYDIGAYEYQG